MWTLTKAHSEGQAVFQAVRGGQDPALVDEDAATVELPYGIQQERLRTRQHTAMSASSQTQQGSPQTHREVTCTPNARLYLMGYPDWPLWAKKVATCQGLSPFFPTSPPTIQGSRPSMDLVYDERPISS